MNVIKQLTPYNFTNKNDAGRIQYIVIHYFGGVYTAAAQAKAWAARYVGASAHYIIGHAGELYQSVADEDIAWHCGASRYKHKKCRNSNSLGIECAVRKTSTKTLNASDTDWYFEPATEQALVELVAEKMKRYQIPLENVLRHYDVTGKTCPNPYVVQEGLWERFRARLEAYLKGEQTPEEPVCEDEVKDCIGSIRVIYQGEDGLNLRTAPSISSEVVCVARYQEGFLVDGITTDGQWYRTEEGYYISASSRYVRFQEGFCVRVTSDSLNIRPMPGTKEAPVGVIKDKGVYTIVAEENGWGCLKSGAGWIKLAYTVRI